MTFPASRTQSLRRRLAWLIPSAVAVVILSACGVYHGMSPPVDDVKWAYIMPALPGGVVLSYYPDRDKDRVTIANAMTLIQQAQAVTDENLQPPSAGGTFVIDKKDGQSISVEYASTCKSSDVHTVSCMTVQDRMMIQDSSRKPALYFAKSVELYRFLQTEFQKSATNSLQETKYPQSVAVGSTFLIEGDGWMTDKVTIRLKNGDQVLWSTDTVPDHGHISLQAKCPPSLTPGDYTLEYSGADWRTISSTIHVYK